MNIPYTTCARCGEAASAALRWKETPVLCAYCQAAQAVGANHSTDSLVSCAVCPRWGVPGIQIEAHHVASRTVYPNFTVWLCLNCHRVISQRQYAWRSSGSAERHPFRYLLVGVADMMRLFLERSPAADACRQVFAMLAQAATLVLSALSLPALCEVGHVLTVLEGSLL